MFYDIYFQFYWMNLWLATAIFIGVILIWSVMGAVFQKRIRILAVILTIISAGLILYITLFSRHSGWISHELMPFSTFTLASERPGLFRAAVMNIFLFIPLGMALPYLFKTSTRNRILLTVLIGAGLSVLIEAAQHFLRVGMTQTDDVICNTLGAAIGMCAYPLTLLWIKLRERRKSNTNR